MTTARRIDVLRAAMTVDERLDDIARAQIWAALEPRLAEPVPARPRWPLALAAVAVAAAITIVWLRPRAPATHTLSAPAETTLAAALGPHTRAELVGPATLELVGAPGDATSVRLRRGTLVAEFAGGPGRSLRIETGDAVVEIVGTLFSVEARDGATCVSVAHGKVRVTSRGGVVAVAGGQSWCSTRPDVEPIVPAAHDRLARFEAVIVARTGTPAPPAVARPEPATVAPLAPVTVAPPPVLPRASPAPSPAHVVVATRPVSQVDPVVPASPPAHAIESVPVAPAAAASPEPAPAPPSTPPSVSPPPPVVAPPAPPSPEALYEAAEAALGKGDTAGADRIFARLLTDYPHAGLVDQALYERARIAYERHAWRDAQRDLDQLAAIAATPLAEPGAYLSCRIAIEAHDGAAEHCLLEYHKAYPSSPHDLDVLGVLTELAHEGGGCARARPRIDELVRAHPRSKLARAWATRCPEDR